MKCAQSRAVGVDALRLAIIDYTLPSSEQRLSVVDIEEQTLLFEEHVTRLSYGPGTAPLSQCGTGSLTLTSPLKQASLYYPCQLASVMALSSREILRNCFFQ